MSGVKLFDYIITFASRLSQQWWPQAGGIRNKSFPIAPADIDLAIGVCEVLSSVRDKGDSLVCVKDSSIKSAGRGLFSCRDVEANTCVVLYPGSYLPPLPASAVGRASGDAVFKPGELGFVDERGMYCCKR